MRPNEKKILAVLGISILASSLVFSEDNIKFELPKTSYKVGDNISANYFIKNPTNQKKTYKVVMACDKAINGEPGCREIYVEVEPGQNVTGKISDMANLSVDTVASFKVIDEQTGEMISEQNKSVSILNPEDIVCGDGKCDEDLGETYDNCPIDCEKRIVCGDGVCDEGENSTSCLKDCPLPTTSTTQPKSHAASDFTGYLPYLGGVAALVVLILASYLFMKKKENKKIEKQRVEFEKWQRDRDALK